LTRSREPYSKTDLLLWKGFLKRSKVVCQLTEAYFASKVLRSSF